jgi:hypothetical protein
VKDGVERVCAGGFELFHRSVHGLSRERRKPGVSLLDRFEVRRVGWEIQQRGSEAPIRCACAGDLVGGLPRLAMAPGARPEANKVAA